MVKLNGILRRNYYPKLQLSILNGFLLIIAHLNTHPPSIPPVLAQACHTSQLSPGIVFHTGASVSAGIARICRFPCLPGTSAIFTGRAMALRTCHGKMLMLCMLLSVPPPISMETWPTGLWEDRPCQGG